MVRAFPRTPCTQTTSVTRRNHATGGAPQFWRNRAFAGTRLAALADLTALWHGTLSTSIWTTWVTGTGLSLAVAVAVIAGYFRLCAQGPLLRHARIRDEITIVAISATTTRVVRLAALVAGVLAGNLAEVSVARTSS